MHEELAEVQMALISIMNSSETTPADSVLDETTTLK